MAELEDGVARDVADAVGCLDVGGIIRLIS
jgi:hypothetical protein